MAHGKKRFFIAAPPIVGIRNCSIGGVRPQREFAFEIGHQRSKQAYRRQDHSKTALVRILVRAYPTVGRSDRRRLVSRIKYNIIAYALCTMATACV